MSKRNSMPGTPVASQQPHYLHPVTVRELRDQRSRFNIDPPFQRKRAWNIRQEQQLYNSMLLGRDIGRFEGYKEDIPKTGGTSISFLDGHQRTTAIYDFVDNRVRTWTVGEKKRYRPNSKPPVEPGKFFNELSIAAQNFFLDYVININIIPRESEQELVERFLDIQCHTALTRAEQLCAHPSKARDAAKLLSAHSFWEEFYAGETNRGQIFQGSLRLLGIEITSGLPVNLSDGTFMNELASGLHDDVITEDLVSRVTHRLDAVSCLYRGMQFTDQPVSVVMYQSAMRVEQAGREIRSSTDRGRLAAWLDNLIAESRQASDALPFQRPIHRLLYPSIQKEFWNEHKRTVMTLMGLSIA